MISILRRLWKSEHGVTVIEYSLIVCLIATAAIGAFRTVGQAVLTRLVPVLNALN